MSLRTTINTLRVNVRECPSFLLSASHTVSVGLPLVSNPPHSNLIFPLPSATPSAPLLSSRRGRTSPLISSPTSLSVFKPESLYTSYSTTHLTEIPMTQGPREAGAHSTQHRWIAHTTRARILAQHLPTVDMEIRIVGMAWQVSHFYSCSPRSFT